jgi:mutator protein MutT
MSYPIKTITTLCYIINDKSEVLLIMKKRGFGVGKWNGPGGKVEKDESPKESMIREIKEEINIQVANPKELGYIEFIWPKKEKNNQRCYIYFAKEFSGQPKETEECLPRWFTFDAVPYEEMWDDDKYWYPDALAGRPVKKRFFFTENNKVLKYEDI